MKLDYARASSLDEAIGLLETLGPGYKPLAGGTDLLTALRRGQLQGVRGVVDLWRADELKGVEERGEEIWVGALTTHAQVAADPVLRRELPVLAAASSKMGSPQIRNRGTIGGNLVNASPCADTVPALVVAGAELELTGPSGSRRIGVEEFILGSYETGLRSDELLAGILLPCVRSEGGWAYLRLGRREALDRARMSVAVLAWLDGEGRLEEVRLAAGAVLPRPRRLCEAEALLNGERPSQRLFRQVATEAARRVVEEAGGRWSARYKEKALAAVLRRGLMRACGLREE